MSLPEHRLGWAGLDPEVLELATEEGGAQSPAVHP